MARSSATAFLCGMTAACLFWCAHAHPAAPAGGYSAAELYNAANAYARAGNTGLAVLNYERAQLLAPRDPDIAANLRLVRMTAHLPDAPSPAIERMLTWAAPDTYAWLGVFGVLLAGAGLLALRRARRGRSWSVLLLSGGALCVALTLANAVIVWPALQAAVALPADLAVRATPAPMGDELFRMRAGDTVHVEAQHEDFLFVRTAEGRAGWMSRAGLALVVPP